MYSKWWSEWKAYLSIAALSIWLYSGIETLYYYWFDVPMKSSNGVIDFPIFMFFLIISVINWFLFEHENKWKRIVQEFDKLPKKQNRIGGILVWTLIILIIIFYWLYSIPLLGKLRYE